MKGKFLRKFYEAKNDDVMEKRVRAILMLKRI